MTIRKLINTLESGSVIRYHALPSVRPQLNAHHAYGVAVIVLYLTRGRAGKSLLIEAFMHDTGELVSGDVPHSAKRDYPEYAKMSREVEHGARLENMLLPKLTLNKHDAAILKLADVLEGLVWCELRESRRSPSREDRWHATFAIKLREFKSVLSAEERARAELIFAAYTHHRIQPEARLTRALKLNDLI